MLNVEPNTTSDILSENGSNIRLLSPHCFRPSPVAASTGPARPVEVRLLRFVCEAPGRLGVVPSAADGPRRRAHHPYCDGRAAHVEFVFTVLA
jgi:hypothetical protein